MDRITEDEATAEAEARAAMERGRVLFAGRCDFIAGAPNLGALPQPRMPEIAFAGRSNVGKSSLLNALTGRKSLARISNTPGRTRQLNFFDLGGRLMLVDLPGYGYARASKTMIRDWTALLRDYMRGRAKLVRLCLLIDARHGLRDSDRELMDMLDDAAVSFLGVLTKVDKLTAAMLEDARRKASEELARHVAAHPSLAVTSSRTGHGIEALRAELAALARPIPVG